MDEFIKSIKNKFSMENIVELLKEDIPDEKKTPEKLENTEPGKIGNIDEHSSKFTDAQSKPSLQQPIDDMKRPSGNLGQADSVTKAGKNVLQKPVEPEDVRDPFRNDDNLFSFYD